MRGKNPAYFKYDANKNAESVSMLCISSNWLGQRNMISVESHSVNKTTLGCVTECVI